MSQTIVGTVTDAIGSATRVERYRDVSKGILDGRRRTFWACPSGKFRATQPPEVPLELGHGGERCGTVQHLELRGGRLWVVAQADVSWDLRRAGPWKFSYATKDRYDPWYDLDAVALVFNSATVCSSDVELRDGTISMAAFRSPRDGGTCDELLHNAEEAIKKRGRGQPIEVRGATPAALEPAAAPSGQIEYRAAPALDVSSRRRQLFLLAAPYDTATTVSVRGRLVSESFSRSAFRGKQPERIFSTRDHDQQRLIGLVTDLQPHHDEGLFATIRVSDTPLGRETVELARDGVVAASIGFTIGPDGERWEGRDHRTVTSAVLREIALVADPAYPTRVVAVRDREPALR